MCSFHHNPHVLQPRFYECHDDNGVFSRLLAEALALVLREYIISFLRRIFGYVNQYMDDDELMYVL